MSTRSDFRWWFRNYRNESGTFVHYFPDITKELCLRMNKKPVYGLAEKKDFGEFADALASLCAYNNKQYYIYRAVSDSNKIGFLSRKQYLRWRLLEKKYGKYTADDYKRNYGRMITLYKMLSNATEENSYAKFLRAFSSFGDKQKDIFEKFSEYIINSTNTVGYEIVPCSVQEAYNLPLRELNHARGRGVGSGSRFAVTSCMEGHKIASFYEGFGAQAYKVAVDGVDIGRFLTWKTNKGRTMVDRLYCNGYEAPRVLSLMENKFGKDALYYPFSPLPSDEYVEVKEPSKFKIGGATPYVDSMRRLYMNQEKTAVYLSNAIVEGKSILSNSTHPERFKICKCGKLLFKGQVVEHELTCPLCAKKKRAVKEIPEILKLYKEVFKDEAL